MPELPEVETIKRELSPHLTGRRIAGTTVLWPGTVRGASPSQFIDSLHGRKIESVGRRGKYLVICLDDGHDLLVHLKMTGSLIVGGPSDEPGKYARVIFTLDNGATVFFRDPRKFGKMQLVARGEVTSQLGIEPLSDDFTVEQLKELLAKRKTSVKPVLLDQNLIAGIGNMYADESLFEAGIHPLRPADSLSETEVARLHDAIRSVLQRAIESKGASIANYFRPDGSAGWAHQTFKVAHRRGERCQCHSNIERIVVRGRGTYFCPACQK